jgi:hypothetical protein
MTGQLRVNFSQCGFMAVPIRDSLRPELAWQAISGRQVRYEIGHRWKRGEGVA